MSTLVAQTAKLLDILPEEEVSIVNALVKKLVIAWDPDFTKVTEEEKKILDQADTEMAAGEFYSEEDAWK